MRIFKIITFLLLIIITMFSAVYFNAYALFCADMVFVLIIVLDVLLFLFSRGLTVGIGTNMNHCSKNSNVKVKLTVKNRSPYPIGKVSMTVSIKNRFYEENSDRFIFPLGMLIRKKIYIPLKPIYSGIYDISISDAEYTDMFGLFRKKIMPDAIYSFTVMPSDNFSMPLDLHGEIDTDSISSDNVYSYGSGDVSGYRQYRDGDRLNSINWKLSARMDKPFVKEYEKTTADETVVLLDMYYDCLDSSLDILYSLVRENNYFYVLWLPAGREEFMVSYVSDKETAENMFADIFNSAPEKIPERGLNEYIRLYRGNKFLYISNKGLSVYE